MRQVVRPNYWALGVPPSNSQLEQVGQLEFIRPNFHSKNITPKNQPP